MTTPTKESLQQELETTQHTMARQALLKQLWKIEQQGQVLNISRNLCALAISE